ncbi:MAG: hypothetical protein HYR94_21205 [Chloroflexi bacterium]|nr:hypothetical protein [Chloroflexota bacterium]
MTTTGSQVSFAIHRHKKLITFSMILADFIFLFSLSGSSTTLAQASHRLQISQQIINVPGDAPTIQAGINLASDGDLVLVAPGVYQENIQLAGKTITLASQFQTSQDPSFIDQTVIDGNGSTPVTVASS